MKRTTGSVLRSRKQRTLFAEAALKVAAYAVRLEGATVRWDDLDSAFPLFARPVRK